MELSDPRVIDVLLAGMVSSRRFTPPAAKLVPATRSKMQRKRCSCNNCPQCLDNKRWELIFNAKFADPNYYKERPIRHNSSLDWLR